MKNGKCGCRRRETNDDNRYEAVQEDRRWTGIITMNEEWRREEERSENESDGKAKEKWET